MEMQEMQMGYPCEPNFQRMRHYQLTPYRTNYKGEKITVGTFTCMEATSSIDATDETTNKSPLREKNCEKPPNKSTSETVNKIKTRSINQKSISITPDKMQRKVLSTKNKTIRNDTTIPDNISQLSINNRDTFLTKSTESNQDEAFPPTLPLFRTVTESNISSFKKLSELQHIPETDTSMPSITNPLKSNFVKYSNVTTCKRNNLGIDSHEMTRPIPITDQPRLIRKGNSQNLNSQGIVRQMAMAEQSLPTYQGNYNADLYSKGMTGAMSMADQQLPIRKINNPEIHCQGMTRPMPMADQPFPVLQTNNSNVNSQGMVRQMAMTEQSLPTYQGNYNADIYSNGMTGAMSMADRQLPIRKINNPEIYCQGMTRPMPMADQPFPVLQTNNSNVNSQGMVRQMAMTDQSLPTYQGNYNADIYSNGMTGAMSMADRQLPIRKINNPEIYCQGMTRPMPMADQPFPVLQTNNSNVNFQAMTRPTSMADQPFTIYTDPNSNQLNMQYLRSPVRNDTLIPSGNFTGNNLVPTCNCQITSVQRYSRNTCCLQSDYPPISQCSASTQTKWEKDSSCQTDLSSFADKGSRTPRNNKKRARPE